MTFWLLFSHSFLNQNMASIAPSDTESNVSGFIRYSDKNIKHLYTSMLEVSETFKLCIKTSDKPL